MGTLSRRDISRIGFLLIVSIVLACIVGYFRMSSSAKADSDWFVVGACIVIGLVGLALAVLAFRSDILRDSTPVDFGLGYLANPPQNVRRPFSLAQSQMAWWFFLIFAAYVYIFLSQGQPPTIPDQALVLMGIGTGTALGAAVVEQTKENPAMKDLEAAISAAAAEQAAGGVSGATQDLLRAQIMRLRSVNFLDDILTDVNGIALHRFQVLVWTLLVGGYFVLYAMRFGSMPTLDYNLLALLGISGGVYLGFKIPEQPA